MPANFPSKRKFVKTVNSLHLVVALAFICNFISPSFAQEVDLKLPAPSKIKPISKVYAPAIIRAVTVNPKDPFLFDFVIDRGDSNLDAEAFEAETQKLVKYFLAALTIPENDLWVNLSPYEQDTMVPQALGVTELGKDLLVEDYYLKQVTAQLTNPNTETGKKFWALAYAKAQELFGTTKVPINTFSKVWIVPDQATVLEKDGSAFIADSHLKVYLDQDYLAIKKNLDNKEIGTDRIGDDKAQSINSFSSQIIKEVVLPEIEKEVNNGENFAAVRQIYSSAILAAWYKKALKQSLLGKLYADQNKVAGVNAEDMESGDKIFAKYTAALKTGAYNIVKQDFDLSTQKIVQRKYFSGGVKMAPSASTRIVQLATTSPTETMSQLSPAATRVVSSAVQSMQQASSGTLGLGEGGVSRFSVARVSVVQPAADVTTRVRTATVTHGAGMRDFIGRYNEDTLASLAPELGISRDQRTVSQTVKPVSTVTSVVKETLANMTEEQVRSFAAERNFDPQPLLALHKEIQTVKQRVVPGAGVESAEVVRFLNPKTVVSQAVAQSLAQSSLQEIFPATPVANVSAQGQTALAKQVLQKLSLADLENLANEAGIKVPAAVPGVQPLVLAKVNRDIRIAELTKVPGRVFEKVGIDNPDQTIALLHIATTPQDELQAQVSGFEVNTTTIKPLLERIPVDIRQNDPVAFMSAVKGNENLSKFAAKLPTSLTRTLVVQAGAGTDQSANQVAAAQRVIDMPNVRELDAVLSSLPASQKVPVLQGYVAIDQARRSKPSTSASELLKGAPGLVQALKENPQLVATLNKTASSAIKDRDDLQAIVFLNSRSQEEIEAHFAQSANPAISQAAKPISVALKTLAQNPENFIIRGGLARALQTAGVNTETALAVASGEQIKNLADTQRAAFTAQRQVQNALPYVDASSLGSALISAGVISPERAPVVAQQFVAFRNSNPSAVANGRFTADENYSEMAGALNTAMANPKFQQSMTPYAPTSLDNQVIALTIASESDIVRSIRESSQKTLIDANKVVNQITQLRQNNPGALRDLESLRQAGQVELADNLTTLVGERAFSGLVDKYLPPTAAINAANRHLIADRIYRAWSDTYPTASRIAAATIKVKSADEVENLLALAEDKGALGNTDLLRQRAPKLNSLLSLPKVRTAVDTLLGKESGRVSSSTVATNRNLILTAVADTSADPDGSKMASRLTNSGFRGTPAQAKELVAVLRSISAAPAEEQERVANMPSGEFKIYLQGKGLSAETVNAYDEKKLGGIDLSAEKMGLQIKRDGNGVVLPIADQDVENLKIDGLAPVILNVQPATPASVPFLMNLSNGTQTK